MIWLTWRRYRRTLLCLILFTLALAAYLFWSGWSLRAQYYRVTDGWSVASCAATYPHPQMAGEPCQQISASWFDNNQDPPDLFALLGILAAPALFGAFLGAPLVASEVDGETYRLLWTQSVTRRRWLLTPLAIFVGFALPLLGVIELATWWWLGPYHLLGGAYASFDVLSMATMAYTLFALALGVAVGALVRRVVPAILVTLGGFAAARILIGIYARPYYLAPLTQAWDPYLKPTPPQPQPGTQDWTIFSGYVTRQGVPIEGGSPPHAGPICPAYQPKPYTGPLPTVGPSWNGYDTLCAHTNGFIYQVIWQPLSRYWLFQGIESAIFLVLALALFALTLWLVRKVIA